MDTEESASGRAGVNVRLEICGVSFNYGSRKVLEDVTFTVAPGDFVALIGPNGSGKSTLLKCICGLLSPSMGTVMLEGHPVRTIPVRALARTMGVVPQDAWQRAEFTVEEVVLMGRGPYLGLMEREGPEDYEAVRDAMEATGTLLLADRLLSQLSGGEFQRVMIARALAQRPQVMLLDEPTAHLDLRYQTEIMTLLKRINEEKAITVIAAIHDLNLAAQYFERFVLMKQGMVYSTGGASQVLNSESLRSVYGDGVVVCDHPLYHWPLITMHEVHTLATATPYAGRGGITGGIDYWGRKEWQEQLRAATGGGMGWASGVLRHRSRHRRGDAQPSGGTQEGSPRKMAHG